MTEPLDDVPLRNAKAELRRGEGPVQKLNPAAGEALDNARENARLEPKQMAGTMGISESLVYRALGSKDDIGFHRLWELDDQFWSELMIAIAKRRRVAIVKTTIELEDRRSA
jgi:hypothetical protein